MKNNILYLCILLLLGGSQSIAQNSIQNKVENSAERKANNRIDNKINSELDKGFNALENMLSKKAKKDKKEPDTATDATQKEEAAGNQSAFLKAFSGSEVKYETNYHFNTTLTLHMSVIDKKGKSEESSIQLLLNKEEQYLAMIPIEEESKKAAENKIIFDSKNKSMLTLVEEKEGERTGMCMPFDPSKLETEANVDAETKNNSKFTKTNEFKEILGYNCQKYLYEDEESQAEYWLTDDLDLNLQEVFGTLNYSNKKQNTYPSSEYPQGMIMESKTKDLNKNTSSIMTVTQVNLKADENFDTKSYNLVNLGGMVPQQPADDKQ